MPDEIDKIVPRARAHLRRVSGNPDFASFLADASGRGRLPLFEELSKVCRQTIPAGATAGMDSTILFDVVRTSERCP